MQIKVVENTPKLIQVALSGELDTFNIEQLDQVQPKLTKLLSVNGQDAVLDVSEVTITTSLGIGLLINLSKLVKKRGNKFVLLKPQADVAKVIQLSKLAELLGVAVDETAAQSMLSASDQAAA